MHGPARIFWANLTPFSLKSDTEKKNFKGGVAAKPKL
jgi:hypothetical protein